MPLRGCAGEFDDVLRRYKPPVPEGQDAAEGALTGKALSQALEDTINVKDVPSALAAEGAAASHSAGESSLREGSGGGSPLLELQSLTLFTPTYSSCLLTNLSLQVRQGEHILVSIAAPSSPPVSSKFIRGLCDSCLKFGPL